MVVDVVEVVVVDEVVVDVDVEVVAAMVVVVVSGVAEVEVSSATDDDVEPLSLVAALWSLLQPATVAAMRMKGKKCVDFTREVWHALYRLPDQGVSLVTTFNKLQCAFDDIDDCDRAVVEAAYHQVIIADRRADRGVDGDEMTEYHGVRFDTAERGHHVISICNISFAQVGPGAAHRLAQPLDSIAHGDAIRRRNLGNGRLDAPVDMPEMSQRCSSLTATQERTGHDRLRSEPSEAEGDCGCLTLADLIEARIGIGVPAGSRSTMAHKV